jgi:tRNA (uracil-5-)-methyltransferase
MQHDTSFDNYQIQLTEKLHILNAAISNAKIIIPEITIFKSPLDHYRMRAEFRIWHQGDESFYGMHHPETKAVYTLESFPIASNSICERMAPLMQAINRDELLSRKAFQVEFLSTTTGEVLISLIYHKKLEDDWLERAKQLETELDAHIIGRSRKQKLVVSKDYVTEHMIVDGQEYRYQQTENGFTQPNATICKKMLQWACDEAASLGQNKSLDLLELYCGNGNFTLPLSKHFNTVLATEVSKTSVRSAQYNIENNHIDNVSIMRLSSEETVQAFNKERAFRRLKDIDLESYRFSTVFVDPPRAGLDPTTLELVKRFDNIIYISCNPETFIDNVKELDGYSIEKFAVFDQFPYTKHVEIGAVLTKHV